MRNGNRETGLSMLEVVVALTLVAVVMLASVQLVTRVVAQIGSARTVQAERAARAKTVASQWIQAELEYLRSLGFVELQRRILNPTAVTPAYSVSAGVAYRDITRNPASLAPGEIALPPMFERARVVLEVEGVDPPGCTSGCRIASIRIRVALYRSSADLPASPLDTGNAFVMSITSVSRP